MKIATNLFLIFTMALSICRSDAFGQSAKRIQFAKGKSSAVVKGATGKYGVTYVIKAKSGQKLVLELAPAAKVGIKVEAMRSYGHTVLLREERGGRHEVGLDESGDCTIFIGSLGNLPVAFTLTVRIEKLADI